MQCIGEERERDNVMQRGREREREIERENAIQRGRERERERCRIVSRIVIFTFKGNGRCLGTFLSST